MVRGVIGDKCGAGARYMSCKRLKHLREVSHMSLPNAVYDCKWKPVACNQCHFCVSNGAELDRCNLSDGLEGVVSSRIVEFGTSIINFPLVQCLVQPWGSWEAVASYTREQAEGAAASVACLSFKEVGPKLVARYLILRRCIG